MIEPNDPLGYQLFVVINHLHPPFDKKEARQALMWGIKQTDYLAAIISDPKRYQRVPGSLRLRRRQRSRVWAPRRWPASIRRRPKPC